MTPQETRPDPRYPQYSVEVRWEEDGEPMSEAWAGSEPGRCKNSTSRSLMFKEDPGEAEVMRETTEEWWPQFLVAEQRGDKPKIGERNPGPPEVMVTRLPDESWMVSWFEHWTFDVGQTDREALDSFERFVRRYERYQDHPSHYIKELGDGYRSLMGAEDRWRWNGGATGMFGPEERKPPPCRCEHCKAQGVIRIGH